MVFAKAVPPVDAAYHCKLVPVAVKLATVESVQKVCDDGATGTVGAVDKLIIALTAVLTQPSTLVSMACKV